MAAASQSLRSADARQDAYYRAKQAVDEIEQQIIEAESFAEAQLEISKNIHRYLNMFGQKGKF